MFVAKRNGDLEETLDDAIDKHGVLKDGGRVSLNFLTMDSDKFVQSEQVCEQAYEAYVERTKNAWRSPTQQRVTPLAKRTLSGESYVGKGNEVEHVLRGREGYIARQANAWKSKP